MSSETRDSLRAEVMLGRSAYIPSTAELSVSGASAKKLGIGFRRRRCELRVGEFSFPVVVGRGHMTTDRGDVARVRVPLVVRLMTGAALGAMVELSPIGRRNRAEWWRDVEGRVRWPEAWTTDSVLSRVVIGVLGLAHLVLRRVHHLVEWTLRLFLGAPTFCFMSQKALPGDDPLDVIRVHRSACEALGVAPGTRVVLSWQRRSTLVRLVEDLDVDGMERFAENVRAVGSVHDVDDDVDVLPRTLVVRVGSRVRAQLGMPPETIVEIRRSVTSSVTRQLSSFGFTLVAVVLSVVGLPDSDYRWWLAAGVGTIGSILVLASIRIPRTAHGLWP